MAAAKKPAKKDDSKKMDDVAKPGTTTPDATSRPIIVTNRPILQDPMVAPETSPTADASTKEPVPATPSSAKVTIKPISVTDNTASDIPADEAPTSAAATENTEPEAETDTPVPVKIDSKTTKKTAKTVQAEPDSDAKAPSEDEASADAKDTAARDAEKPADETPETTTGTEHAEPAEQSPDTEAAASESETADESSAEATKPETPEAADAAAKRAAEDEAKHDAAIEQIAESKQYFLPIKTEEQRKTARFALLGTLLIVVLGLAWLDVALDAGLVQLGSVKPLTHFFSQQASVNVPTAATPVVTSKTFAAPVAKVSFRYPSDWQLATTGSTAQSDTVSLQPSSSTSSISGVNVIFLSLPVASPTGSYSVKYAHYQKLPRQIAGSDVYVRDLIYQDASATINLVSSLSNDQSVQAGQTLKTTDQNFKVPNGTDAYFAISAVKVAGGVSKFSSVADAQKFMQSHQYQQARTILLSTNAQK